jgi:CHASE2 domain-containing sensor protein
MAVMLVLIGFIIGPVFVVAAVMYGHWVSAIFPALSLAVLYSVLITTGIQSKDFFWWTK